MQSLSKSIFYIKYFAKKHGKVIERKATLDDNGCGEHRHKKYGYPYFKYVDLDMTEQLGYDKDGNPLNNLCDRIAELCFQRGLLVVHTGRESIKLAPPLTMNEEALKEGIDVIRSSINDAINELC